MLSLWSLPLLAQPADTRPVQRAEMTTVDVGDEPAPEKGDAERDGHRVPNDTCPLSLAQEFGRRAERVAQIGVRTAMGQWVFLTALALVSALAAALVVRDHHQLVFISQNGMVQRIAVKDIRPLGRNTQGFRLMNIKDGDEVSAVARKAFAAGRVAVDVHAGGGREEPDAEVQVELRGGGQAAVHDRQRGRHRGHLVGAAGKDGQKEREAGDGRQAHDRPSVGGPS